MAFTYFIFGLLCETFNTFLLIFYSTTLIIGLLKIYWLYHALRSCTNNWLLYSIIWWYKHMSTYITQYLINFLQNISNRHCIIHRQWISTSKSHLDTSRNLFLIRFDVFFFCCSDYNYMSFIFIYFIFGFRYAKNLSPFFSDYVLIKCIFCKHTKNHEAGQLTPHFSGVTGNGWNHWVSDKGSKEV